MKITKRNVDALKLAGRRYAVWDEALPGFGVRVEVKGSKTFICRYRSSGIRRQYTIGRYGVLTTEEARAEARRILGAVALGNDPSSARQSQRAAVRFCDLVDAFLQGHGPKLKQRTCEDYESALRKHAVPALGHMSAETISPADLNKIHVKLAGHPHRANRVMAYVSSIYSWGGKQGIIPRDCNPARNVARFREEGRERYLSSEELERLGAVLRKAETDGLEWTIKAGGDTAKHLPKPEKRKTVYSAHVTGAIRLLLLTGCRLREILNLRWSEVDFERSLLNLPDSKTGRKVVFLNAAAAGVLKELPRVGSYVIPGNNPDRPRHDLKKPWEHMRRTAGIEGVRIHDLRHTHASIGAGSGLGLPIVGKLLGHKCPATTVRYAHFADDPLRHATEMIGENLTRSLNAGSD